MQFNKKNNSLANILGDIIREYENANIKYRKIENSNVENNEMQDVSEQQSEELCATKPEPEVITPKPQGVIDSISEQLTPVRLQQAIILSEIVGKPRSKTRKRRRF